jgi:aldehyde:ferredoxin oxidoreductase
MPYGWAGKILEVDLSSGAISTRDTMAYATEWIGGRALAGRLLWEELPAGIGTFGIEPLNIEPFDPGNVVVIATGPLTGTLAPTTGRTVMMSVSPRTYPFPWHTHSTLGGWLGPALKYAGFDAVIVKGASARPVCLEITSDGARLVDAGDLWGRGARETQLALKRRLGAGAQILTIGQAGEHMVRTATVQHSEENAAAHSGFGAVWGSKRLKAIAIVGSGSVKVAHPDRLLAEVARLGKYHVTPSSLSVAAVDRKEQRPVCSQACTFHCFVNRYTHRSDGRRVPNVCIGVAWHSDGGLAVTEYKGGDLTVPAGPNFGKDEEIGLHELANDLGLDMWFRLGVHPWLVRARELGIEEIRGERIEPHSAAWFERFMHQIANREGIGDIFAESLRRAMDALEGELPEELIRLGRALEFGFGFSAHREGRLWDYEPLPFWAISALMYASESRDPTIGTHQSALLHANFVEHDAELAGRRFRQLSEQAFGYPDAFEPTFDHKTPITIWTQHQHMLVDSLPLCDFAFPMLIRPLAGPEDWATADDVLGDLDLGRRLLAAVTGVEYSQADLDRVAERAFTLERVMLARAGRSRPMEHALVGHFKRPCRDDGTVLDEVGFARMLDEYYAARGWDGERGWPEASTLGRLGLP